MAQSRSLYLGPRLKRLRRELGLTQQAMAADLGISPSYVALLERNQRPLTADLLLRLARGYKLNMDEIAVDDSADYARRIGDTLRDPIFADIDLPALELADLASNFPGVSEALLRLHGAYQREQQALTEQRFVGAGELAAPEDEVRQFVTAHNGYFHSLDLCAEELASKIEEAGGAVEWLRNRGIRVRFFPPEILVDSIRRYDRHNDQLLIDETLDAARRGWQLAIHIAYTAMRSQIREILRAEKFAGQTAAHLARRALAGYGAAALLMPYGRFAKEVESRRYDVEALSRQFGTSFEAVANRLTSLRRPGSERAQFFFICIDEAGNILNRAQGADFPFPAHGNGCPLWRLHRVFRQPDEMMSQWLEFPDGRRFFTIARRVIAGGGSYTRRTDARAIGLACRAEDACKLVYSDGTNAASMQITPVGVTCRLCHRPDCEARTVPPIGREILPDDYRGGRAPFAFAES